MIKDKINYLIIIVILVVGILTPLITNTSELPDEKDDIRHKIYLLETKIRLLENKIIVLANKEKIAFSCSSSNNDKLCLEALFNLTKKQKQLLKKIKFGDINNMNKYQQINYHLRIRERVESILTQYQKKQYYQYLKISKKKY